MIFGSGCTARVYTPTVRVSPAVVEEEPIDYVAVVPPNIEAYPRYYYGGGYAYYVDGRWYRHGARGWGYYRREPPPLARQRPYLYRGPRPGVVEAQPRDRGDWDRHDHPGNHGR